MDNKRFLNAKDVAALLNVSVPMAYKIIHRLNDELSDQGYLTIAGRVSRSYFEQKTYDGIRKGRK